MNGRQAAMERLDIVVLALEAARSRVLEVDHILALMSAESGSLYSAFSETLQIFALQSEGFLSMAQAVVDEGPDADGAAVRRSSVATEGSLDELAHTCFDLTTLVFDLWPNVEADALQVKDRFARNLSRFEHLCSESVRLAFPGALGGPSFGDGCVRHLARQYLKECQRLPGFGPLPRSMDDLALACLLVCSEIPETLMRCTEDVLTACRDAAPKPPWMEWLDALPWDLSRDLLLSERGVPMGALDTLTANFTHSNSGIRAFMFELGWFVRNWLNPAEVAPLLLQNVADTLGYWEDSLGLCCDLGWSLETFWAFADDFAPEARFESQYRERLSAVREQGIVLCQHKFLELDMRIRRMVTSFAYGLRSVRS